MGARQSCTSGSAMPQNRRISWPPRAAMDWQPRKGEPSVRDEKGHEVPELGGWDVASFTGAIRACSVFVEPNRRTAAGDATVLSLAAACALSLLVPLKEGLAS